MGVFNGGNYLAQQLQSLQAQTYPHWRLIVSEDGSGDESLQILKHMQDQWGADRLEIRHGPQKGFCQNFLSMACDPSIQADYYAFCDQDDVWLPEKLTQALAYLSKVPNPDIPHLYCGRTAYVRDDLQPFGYSEHFKRTPSFHNALVQCIAGANTMVFNRAAKTLLEKTGGVQVPSHDWWLYQLVSGAGGGVHYDARPFVLYRQHAGSQFGENRSLSSKIRRIKLLIQGQLKRGVDQNFAALNEFSGLLTEDARETLHVFNAMRSAGLQKRLSVFDAAGVYRQTRLGNLGLYIAALLKKM
jgi:glycosyltransferase involved in cell wall biosynthesis